VLAHWRPRHKVCDDDSDGVHDWPRRRWSGRGLFIAPIELFVRTAAVLRPSEPLKEFSGMMQINDPATLAEVNAAFNAYERALVSNDIPELDRLFWDSPHTLRYGAGENLYGIEAIRTFRTARPGKNLAREITERSVTAFGKDFAVANIAFRRTGEARIGRQTQSWVRLPTGWQVVAAHVSWADA
jgi:hypothetical protein